MAKKIIMTFALFFGIILGGNSSSAANNSTHVRQCKDGLEKYLLMTSELYDGRHGDAAYMQFVFYFTDSNKNPPRLGGLEWNNYAMWNESIIWDSRWISIKQFVKKELLVPFYDLVESRSMINRHFFRKLYIDMIGLEMLGACRKLMEKG